MRDTETSTWEKISILLLFFICMALFAAGMFIAAYYIVSNIYHDVYFAALNCVGKTR